MAGGITKKQFEKDKKQSEEAVQQLGSHHEGMTSCDVCGWLSDETEPGEEEEE